MAGRGEGVGHGRRGGGVSPVGQGQGRRGEEAGREEEERGEDRVRQEGGGGVGRAGDQGRGVTGPRPHWRAGWREGRLARRGGEPLRGGPLGHRPLRASSGTIHQWHAPGDAHALGLGPHIVGVLRDTSSFVF